MPRSRGEMVGRASGVDEVGALGAPSRPANRARLNGLRTLLNQSGSVAFAIGFVFVLAVASVPWGTGVSQTPSAQAAVVAHERPTFVEPVAVLPEPRSLIASPDLVEVPRLPDALFSQFLREEPSLLGSISIGRPNQGFLFNGVHMGEGEHWELVDPDRAWGTQETIAALQSAILEVKRLYPETPKLHVGHISKQHGGWLRPHRSHQSGRDVDLGLYYNDGGTWYQPATPETFDTARSWALLSALARSGQVEYVFLDQSLHALLREQAQRIEEDAEFVRRFFEGNLPQQGPVLRHARGHRTHLHIRFVSEVAVENAQRARRLLGPSTGRAGRLLTALMAKQRQSARARATARR